MPKFSSWNSIVINFTSFTRRKIKIKITQNQSYFKVINTHIPYPKKNNIIVLKLRRKAYKNPKMERINMITLKVLSLLLCIIFGAATAAPAPLSTQEDGIYIGLGRGVRCSTQHCTRICNNAYCGSYRCPGGFCVTAKKYGPAPLCLCTPRRTHSPHPENWYLVTCNAILNVLRRFGVYPRL